MIETVQLPLAMLLSVAVISVGVVRFRRGSLVVHSNIRPAMTGDRAFLVVVIAQAAVVFAVAAEALGQWLVVLPLIVVLIIAASSTLPIVRLRVGLALAIAGMCVVNLVMVTDVFAGLGRPRTVESGLLGPLTITDGRQFIQRHFAGIGDTGRPGQLPDSFRRWLPVHAELTAWFLRYAAEHDERPVVFTAGNESRLLNLNDLLLADRLVEDDGVLLVGRIFIGPSDSRQTLRQQVDDPSYGLPNFVITRREETTPDGDRVVPLIERVVQAAGFKLVRTVRLPDGPARIFWRPQADVLAPVAP